MRSRRLTLAGVVATFLLALLLPGVANAAWQSPDRAGDAGGLWPWSVPAPSIPERRAYLWIAPQTQRVRGIVVGLQNMLEQPLFERRAFRDACAANDLALVLIFPGRERIPSDDKIPDHPRRSALDLFLNPDFPRGAENPASAGADLQAVLDALAAESGFDELRSVPLMPVGHSSAGSFVWHLYRWDPSRIFAMMPLKTGMKDDGPAGIPIFNVESEWFDYGRQSKNLSNLPSAAENWQRVRTRNEESLFGFYLDVGSGHCNVSDDSVRLIALFLKKAVAARIPADSPVPTPVKLKEIDRRTGWLLPAKSLGQPGSAPAPYAEFVAAGGDPRQAFWYLDGELANAVQEHVTTQRAKKPQQVNFVKSDGTVPADGGTFQFTPTFIDDLGTFKLEARYLDQLSQSDLYPPATKLSSSGEPILYRVNSGAVTQIGPNAFRILPHGGPLLPQGNPWEPTLIAYTPGNAEFRPTERPAHANVNIVNTKGSSQTIDFPAIPNVRLGSISNVPLKATASSGLPVQYFVVSGPAEVAPDGQSLILLPAPARSRYPMRVLVSAFQWGRPAEPQVQTAGPVMRGFFISRETAQTLPTGSAVMPLAKPAPPAEPPFADPSPAPPPESRMALWYRQPARNWIEALALGNGRLGAMVFGGIERERIGLNEDTLWSGGPYQPAREVPPETLAEIRRLAFAGKLREAQNLANKLQGVPGKQASYQTIGELRLAFAPAGQPSGYRRELDLDTAVARVSYSAGGVRFTREYFVTPVDQVLVVRLTADTPGQITFDTTYESPQQPSAVDAPAGANDVILTGRNGDMQTRPVIPAALTFQSRARIVAEGGQTTAHQGAVSVKNADRATLYIASATSYRHYDDVGGDPDALCRETLAKLARKPYESMRDAHIAAHQALFRRVSIELGDSAAARQPTDQRLRHFADGNDPALPALYFQFGRYLLISSSRPGSQPANLQGLWNQDLMAAWGGKYTVNINTEMNYWPSLAGNLPEMQEPLLQMMQDCSITGAITAQKLYHARGWVLHHNTDLWRATAPIDSAYFGMWQTGGAWLMNTLYEEYRFGGDRQYLAKVYPLMKGSAQFFLDTLVEEPTHHWLVTCPANSPEHEREKGLTNSPGPAMDMAILRELFGNCVQASQALGTDEEFRRQCEQARDRLAPYQVGREGQLQEWLDDIDASVPEIQHRHMSPLYGLYPGHDITPADPKLFAAARKLMEMRGGNTPSQMGWAVAWRAALWARLLDADQAYACLQNLLVNRTESNLFDKPSVQLDGNFGGTAAIAEMLLQSHRREIHLLPALPRQWPAGKVTGLRARGGATVDISWSGGHLALATIRAARGGDFIVHYGGTTANVHVPENGAVTIDKTLAETTR